MTASLRSSRSPIAVAWRFLFKRMRLHVSFYIHAVFVNKVYVMMFHRRLCSNHRRLLHILVHGQWACMSIAQAPKQARILGSRICVQTHSDSWTPRMRATGVPPWPPCQRNRSCTLRPPCPKGVDVEDPLVVAEAAYMSFHQVVGEFVSGISCSFITLPYRKKSSTVAPSSRAPAKHCVNC